MTECTMCYRPLYKQSSVNDFPETISEEPQVTAKHTIQQWILHCMSCNLHVPKHLLIVLVLVFFILPLKADLQTLACSSEYRDNDHSLMPAQGHQVLKNRHIQLKLGVRTEGPCTIDHDQ